MTRQLCAAALAGLLLMAPPAVALAGEADVVGVAAYPEGPGLWRFEATLRHADTGWDHYADKWEVVGPDGTIYGMRELLHPHETEQPFTRSLGGVAIPEGVTRVKIRAHDSVHGYGGREMTVELDR
jgi:hypothetical protein